MRLADRLAKLEELRRPGERIPTDAQLELALRNAITEAGHSLEELAKLPPGPPLDAAVLRELRMEACHATA